MKILMIQIALAMLLLVQAVVARCPNWCNKRGECTSPADGGYCVCHYGFTGEDCSQRLCPAGFDPVNLEKLPQRRTIRLETGHMGGVMMGKYSFSFAGSDVYLPAHSNDNDETKCVTALKSLKSVQDVSCKREKYDVATGAGSYLISLLAYPQKPYMNNLIHHNGNPGINLFNCDVTKIDHEEASEPYCFVSNADNTTEFPLYAECGNHGVCDRIKGVCACESGFKGDACLDNSDDENIIEHIHEGPYFTANLLKLHLEAPPSMKFNLFQASLNNNNVTTIRGDSVLLHKGDVRMEGSLRVGSGAINEGQDGAEGSANIHGSLEDPITTTHHLALYTNNNPVYTISTSGDTTIAGTLDVLNHTLTVEPRLITAQNLKLSNDLHVQGSANIEESLTIGSGFALTPGGITVDVATHTGTLFELKSRQEGFNGTLFELSSVGEDNVLIKTVTNGLSTFELHASGFVNMNGLRLKSGGVQVESGGIEVLAGGMNVQGGISILSGGLALPAQPFTVGTLHATNSETNLQESIISGATTNPHYAGSMLELTRETTDNSEAGLDGDSADMMSFINLQHAEISTADASAETDNTNTTPATSVFQVKGSGQIDSAAGAVFKGPQGVDVYGSMLMRGKLALQPATLATGDSSSTDKLHVVVPLNATYVVVTRTTDTSTASMTSIDVAFEPSLSSHSAGRILLISNNDSTTTSGSVQIPPYTTVLLVYDGAHWTSVDALKAPMHVLENVRTFTAAADLDIGPHTLSALRFQSTSLHTNSIIYSGNSGILTTSDKFTYTKGVLAVPAMKVENLLCALDARGNDISNALLTNAKMIGASISADDVTIPGLAGLAYFNNKGTLQASTTLALDPEGRLLVSNLYTNVQANGFSIANTTIIRANLSSVGYVKTSELYISGLNSGDGSGSVLVSSADGKVGSTNSMTIENNIVTIQKLHATTLAGNIDANHHTINNVNIKGSSANVKSVTTDTLTISSVANPSSKTNRLVYADSTGKISAQEGNNVVHINSLSVNDIVYASNTVDFHGRTVKNIVLDTDTFMLGPQKSLYTDELTITSSANDSVLIAKNGIVVSSGMRYKDNALYVGETSSVYTHNLYTTGITISSIKNGVLSTSSNGTVVGTNQLDLDSVTVDKAVHLSATAKLTLSGLTPNTLLTVNANHQVTTIPATYSKTATSVDAYLHNLHTDSLHSAVLSSDKASVKELTLVTSGEKNSETVSGTVLVQNKDGKVSALSEEVVYMDKGSLHVSSIAPVKGSDSVSISAALLLHSNLSSSHIHNAHSVDTNKLIVKDIAEFYSDVVIDGSVTIHGTVIGSGPYVDSSDARFKSNVTTLINALDTVNQLRPVSYVFNTAAFPTRQFPASPQLGFIAQEVESLQPELVYSDSEGYKGVSYAHVNVLLTAAVQEMQRKHEKEMKALKEEVSELKSMVQTLLKLKQ